MAGDGSDYFEPRIRLQKHFSIEENDRLTFIMYEQCDAACQRAIFGDRVPQGVAS